MILQTFVDLHIFESIRRFLFIKKTRVAQFDGYNAHRKHLIYFFFFNWSVNSEKSNM